MRLYDRLAFNQTLEIDTSLHKTANFFQIRSIRVISEIFSGALRQLEMHEIYACQYVLGQMDIASKSINNGRT